MAWPAPEFAFRVNRGQTGVFTDSPDRPRAHARLRRTGVHYVLEER